MNDLTTDLAEVLRRHGLDQESQTPADVLAAYVWDCLGAWKMAVEAREHAYGRAEILPPRPPEEQA